MTLFWYLVFGFGTLIVAWNAVLYALRGRALRRLPACDREDALGALNAAWAFGKECAATAAVVVSVPFGWVIARCRSRTRTRGAVLLVHGWSLNRGSLWLLRRRLVRDGWGPVCCFDYWSLTADVERAAARMHHAVDALAAGTGDERLPVTLIGHSLGGLVLRHYARHAPASAVKRIVTLGTPHGGTQLARRRGRVGRKLAPGSPWLSSLQAADPVPTSFDVIAIHSAFDAMILPPQCAEYPGAFNIRVNDVGHNALLFSSKVYALLLENLQVPL